MWKETTIVRKIGEKNNIFIVKRVHEILESLQFDLTPIKINLLEHAVKNNFLLLETIS